MTWRAFFDLVLDAARSTGIVGLIIASALVFNYLVASENIPGLVAALSDRRCNCRRSSSCSRPMSSS